MSFALGVAAFAIALVLSVAWHECGHMWAAQATGMKVRRFFVGFGPTLWSARRGDTEYGFKALPLGGFCDIAGMTPYDELTPSEQPRAMYKQKPWKRLVVLFAGPLQNFILGFVLIIVLAVGWGLPNLKPEPTPAVVASTFCVAPQLNEKGENAVPCAGAGPAAAAGLRAGDKIVSANGKPVTTAAELSPLLAEATGPVQLGVERGGQLLSLTVTPTPVTITGPGPNGTTTTQNRQMVGLKYPAPPAPVKHNVLSAIPASVAFTGQMFEATWDALLSLPTKIGALWTAVTGGERSPDTPISVWGASVIGGDAVERGVWELFLGLLISINFFLGLFNLVPLLPLDGGHMAVVLYEKIRDTVRRRFGKTAAGPVDYMKLMPVTYAAVAVMGAFMVLTLTADIINPIQLF
ncbi:putative peptidase M50 family protein [Gordonia araii NBRC 100433]|uniref:Zinc metalloprotease Rip1 n=1 Tax=Gordonia araii NBRC 100433 TaxID=1073574 RepID=G7H507_9ACTN|nr:site-2 protease family protein [Gordonia araii]NNG96622.1 site-2 protease family protein [Gordonia araii NBRC 100433]GAB10932.1 putative peptidase M50 family protein [Gordonia araii NBRC 100433]